MRRINNFDYLRLFLAMEVLVVHAYNLYYPDAIRPIIPPVSTFACMSGLLIPQSYTDSRSWKHFAWRRLIRVYPAFFVSLILVAVLVGADRLPATLLCYATAGLMGPTSANRALWSLMVDEVCYAWHPISRITNLWNAKLCTILMFSFYAMSCVPHFPGRVLLGLVACFFAGNLLYLCKDEVERVPTWVCFAILFVTCFACFELKDGAVFQFFSLPASVMPIVLSKRLAQGKLRIPDLSYGTYVYHLPILYALAKTGAKGIPLVVLVSCTTLAAAVASWYLVEAQALKYKDWSPNWRKSLPSEEPQPADSVA